MLATAKKHWNELKSSPPGRRFQERYERRKKEHRGSFHWARWLNIIGGTLLLLAGVFMLAVPGPGTLVAIAGLSLLGSEFRTLARFLDWSEVKLRKVFAWALRWWSRTGWAVRTSLILLICLVAAGAIYGGYALLMRS